MKKINEILNEKNFKLVENIKNADLVLEEKEIHGLKTNYKKTKNVYIKKAQKTNKKSNFGSGLGLLLYLLIGVMISPILTFQLLPLWGKVLIITNMVGIILFEIETAYHIKNHYYETKKCQKIANILFAIVYVIYGRNTFAIHNTYKKYGNGSVDFKNTLIIFAISIVVVFLFVLIFRLLYYKFKEKATLKTSFFKNKIIFIISISIILTISIITGFGLMSGDISSSGEPDVIELVGFDGFEVNDTGVVIGYKLKNNSPSTLYRINSCKFSFSDTEGNVYAEKEFENLRFENGSLEPNTEGIVMLYFSFPNEANQKLWEGTEQLSLETQANFVLN